MQMTTPKSSATPRIACYGTAFLADAPADAKLLMRAIPAEIPQFSSPRLDAWFLINCGRFLSGTMGSTPSTYVKRVAGTDFRSLKTTVLYECSSALCVLLAALTPSRAAEMATGWHEIYGQQKTGRPQPNGRTQRRLVILKYLAALSKKRMDCQTRLMLRIDYRNSASCRSSSFRCAPTAH